MSEAFLEVEKLTKHFRVKRGRLFDKTPAWIRAVDEVDFAIGRSEVLGLVGESGCGKSTIALCVLQVHKPSAGIIRVGGMRIADKLNPQERRFYRGSVQAMFQDPYSSLSPRLRVRDIIGEPLVVNTKMTKVEIDDRVKETISQVGLPADSPGLYPHEFSGGQRQRVALARALALKPKLLVLDEPVSGLDVSIKAQVLNLLKDLQQSLGVAYLLISHNLGDVRYMSNKVAVMYLGKIVESAASEKLFRNPLHPYTQALLSAALPSRPNANHKKGNTITGEIPNPIDIPSGCPFHTRCPKRVRICSEEKPSDRAINGHHNVRCHLFT